MPGNPLYKGNSRSSNNLAGNNGLDNGSWPEEEVLKNALFSYVTEQLPLNHQLIRLQEEFGLVIGITTLGKLRKHFNVPTARRQPPQDIADQLVLNKMSDLNDIHGRWGVQRTMAALAKDGTPVKRKTVREVMRLNDPQAVDQRYPGKKYRIRRTQLSAIGPFHEVNCDGHDKLASSSLRMGPVGFPIYGMKDKWSGCLLRLVVVPNNRLANSIGHVFLDFVEEFGAIPVQITVDHGTETGQMHRFQDELRQASAPELDIEKCPSFVALTSTHNIPIEGAWHWFREQTGSTLHYHITQGNDRGIFNPNNDIHVQLFNWIWPPVIQNELDKFLHSWNTHRIRSQKSKLMPSGSTLTMFFTAPQHFGGKPMGITVDTDAVKKLRAELEIPKAEAFQWVSDEFAAVASEVHRTIGTPDIDLGTAWAIFEQMSPILRGLYNSD